MSIRSPRRPQAARPPLAPLLLRHASRATHQPYLQSQSITLLGDHHAVVRVLDGVAVGEGADANGVRFRRSLAGAVAAVTEVDGDGGETEGNLLFICVVGD